MVLHFLTTFYNPKPQRMRLFIFHKEQEYKMIIELWQSLGFHFAIKREFPYDKAIIVYLLDSSGN